MKRSVVAAASAVCWAGAVAIVIAGFTNVLGDDDEQLEWSRLSSLLITLAAVTSLIWVFDRYVVTPRSAFRLGVEAGERNERRRAKVSSLVPFSKVAGNGQHKTSAR